MDNNMAYLMRDHLSKLLKGTATPDDAREAAVIYLLTEPSDGEDGRLKQTTLDFISVFAHIWPGSNYGPAHILIDDRNVNDSDIDFCIERTQAQLDGKEESSERRSKAELLATLAFLNCIKQIPEDDR